MPIINLNEQKRFFEKHKPFQDNKTEEVVYVYYNEFDDEYQAHCYTLLTESLLQTTYEFFTDQLPNEEFYIHCFEYFTNPNPIENIPEQTWVKGKLIKSNNNIKDHHFCFTCGFDEISGCAIL